MTDSRTDRGGFSTAQENGTDRSLGDLVSEVASDLGLLMRQEVQLAKVEMKQEAVDTGKAAGLLGAAGFAGYMTLLFLSIALWWGLSNVMDQGWAALIVAALWAIAGAVLYVVGRERLKRLPPFAENTMTTLKEVPQALKGR